MTFITERTNWSSILITMFIHLLLWEQVPGDAEDVYNSMTYIRDMKSTKERVLTNFVSLHESSILALLLRRIVNVFRTLNSRRIAKRERQSFPYDFGERI